MEYDVKDLKLANRGRLKMEWAARFMPVLNLIKESFKRKKIKITANSILDFQD